MILMAALLAQQPTLGKPIDRSALDDCMASYAQTAALTKATALSIAMKSLEVCKAEQRRPHTVTPGSSMDDDQAAVKRVVALVNRLR